MENLKYIKLLFYFIPFVLFVQFAYGLIVREPYPSFMMPGFSRVESNTNTYELLERRFKVVFDDGQTNTVELKDISQNFSKIALSYAVDLAFFNDNYEQIYNSHQKKYYQIIESILGKNIYQEYIIKVRNPIMSDLQIAQFSNWLKINFSKELKQEVVTLVIERVKYTKEFKTGKTIDEVLLDQVTI